MFDSNLAGSGGAIYMSQDATLDVRHSIFNGNTAFVGVGSGGAIALGNGNTTIAGSRFTGNNAANGGAVFATSTGGNTLFIRGSTFVNNAAGYLPNTSGGGVGGAIEVAGSTLITDIYASIFRDNHAINNGGAIGTISAGNTLAIRASTITNNDAHLGGGLYYLGGPGLTVRGSVFSRNSTINSGSGGAIFNIGHAIIRRSSITHNTAELDGGGIFNDTNAVTDLKATLVTNNTPNNVSGPTV